MNDCISGCYRQFKLNNDLNVFWLVLLSYISIKKVTYNEEQSISTWTRFIGPGFHNFITALGTEILQRERVDMLSS